MLLKIVFLFCFFRLPALTVTTKLKINPRINMFIRYLINCNIKLKLENVFSTQICDDDIFKSNDFRRLGFLKYIENVVPKLIFCSVLTSLKYVFVYILRLFKNTL